MLRKVRQQIVNNAKQESDDGTTKAQRHEVGWRLERSSALLTIAVSSRSRFGYHVVDMRCFRIFAVLLTEMLFNSGCSTFNRDWKTAAANPAPETGLEGRWQGDWLSGVNGHSGRLRCIVTDSADGSYQARFKAKYRKVLSFGYTVPLKVERTENLFRFQGEADLGWLAGGVYHYAGRAGPTNFFSTYSCKYDHGTFRMGRP